MAAIALRFTSPSSVGSRRASLDAVEPHGFDRLSGISRSLGILGLAGGISFIVAMVGGLPRPLLQLLRVVAPLRRPRVGQRCRASAGRVRPRRHNHAQLDMGESWRVGIDTTETTTLVRTGTFSLVRNPIFAAMVVFTLGETLLAPTPLRSRSS